MAPSANRMPERDRSLLFAHEAIHLLQHRRGDDPGARDDVELEAHSLAPRLLEGVLPPVRFRPYAPVLLQTPHDQMVVERAKRRAAVLRTYLDEWAAREARRLSIARERDPLLAHRERMDREMASMVPGEHYERLERGHLQNLNRRPLRIEVTEDAIRFHVNFQVRFEGATPQQAAAQFPTLRTNLTAGVREVWNQRLRGMPLSGRSFEVIPTLTLVPANAPRDQNAWLITVRPSDTAPMTYDGAPMGDAPGGVPTSVTDPGVGGGVMSIPPSHISRPSVLGHETLHLFGLVDRYMAMVHLHPSGRRQVELEPLRNTGGRPDPLATGGKILSEDLTYLFERLGVYDVEANRGLETLRRLEREGLSHGQVVAELHRQDEIIRLGRDPRSLLPLRRDFTDRMIRDAENL